MRWLALLVGVSLLFTGSVWYLAAGWGGEAGPERIALIRLEDVSLWYALQDNGLATLRDLADFLHSEGVPFHISLIPVYKDPPRGVELSIGDLNDPRVREFNDTIKYMVARGGVVGLHGYTHQYGNEVSAAGFEFAWRGEYASPEYAANRVQAAVELARKAGIPVTYWETPHYTASPAQYSEFARHFSILYEPDPLNKRAKKIAVAKGLGGREAVFFVPAPLGLVGEAGDVNRMLRRVDRRRCRLASFFFHPFREYRHVQKADGSVLFYTEDNNGYLRALVRGLKDRGYRFMRVDELVDRVARGAEGLSYETELGE
ncbi:DUF2334 domain-containing protein [Desulfothermobacter acidiphilus]|uniref:DUF2334 domain-containing protein n=1 Tax=Desulfothermobacter acidiphilus TaxID=1938353 RepID=UPI003F89BD33